MNLNLIVLLETAVETRSLGERMELALLNTVMSILIVFAVLILISLIISCFKFINKAQMAQEAKKKNAQTVSPEETAASSIVENEEVQEEDETELIAVITAAIHAYEEANGNQIPADGLVVRSIRRVNKSRWQRA